MISDAVHVNKKPCSGMRYVQNIGMPVTFNTGFKTVISLFLSSC